MWQLAFGMVRVRDMRGPLSHRLQAEMGITSLAASDAVMAARFIDEIVKAVLVFLLRTELVTTKYWLRFEHRFEILGA
jgi:hypothetical protein